MCCSVNFTEEKSKQKTKIYTKEKMLEKAEKNEGMEALFFKYKNLKFCILYTKDFCASTQTSELSFYAMSRGFENYTETGYQSNFVQRGEDARVEDVENFFKVQLSKVGIDLENPKPQILTEVGGIAEIIQPSLF